jgi:hypothetical protein
MASSMSKAVSRTEAVVFGSTAMAYRPHIVGTIALVRFLDERREPVRTARVS